MAILVALLAPQPAAAGAYYSCRLADGRILMREIPCPPGARTLSARTVEEKEPAADAQAEPPPAARDAARVGPPPDSAKGPLPDRAFVDPAFDTGFFAMVMLRARLMKVVSSLHSLKTSVMMHYAETGSWPAGAADMNLDPATMSSDEITRVHFGRDGTIVAELAPSFGRDRRIAFRPRWVLGGAELDWECLASFPEAVFDGMAAPPCKSRVIGAIPGG